MIKELIGFILLLITLLILFVSFTKDTAQESCKSVKIGNVIDVGSVCEN